MPTADMYVLDGEIINIGPWNDGGGENPLPKGAVFVKKGTYVVTDRGRFVLPTQTDVIEAHKAVDITDLKAKVDALTQEVTALKSASGKAS
jgi:hypothetical protein